MMSSNYDKISRERGAIETAIGKIPGYKGYKEKEMRRESDRLLRESLVRDFRTQLDRLARIQSSVLDNGGLQFMSSMGGVSTGLQTLIDRIRNAPMGYAGFFDAVRVKEDDLDRLEAFDQQLAGEVAKVGTALDALDKAAVANDPAALKEAIRGAQTVIGDASALFDQRAGVLKGI
jgi:hypothetical protein